MRNTYDKKKQYKCIQIHKEREREREGICTSLMI